MLANQKQQMRQYQQVRQQYYKNNKIEFFQVPPDGHVLN